MQRNVYTEVLSDTAVYLMNYNHISPSVLNIPHESFRTFIDGTTQLDIAMCIAENPANIIILSAPTGSGKSTIAYTVSQLLGRTFFISTTKLLQDQMSNEFTDLFDIRGANNYTCRLNSDLTTCNQGVCTVGQSCDYKYEGCTYYDKRRELPNHRRSISNIDFLSSNINNLEPNYDLLVLDEAHNLIDKLSEHQSLRITHKVYRQLGFTFPNSNWITWAGNNLEFAKQKLVDAISTGNIKQALLLKNIVYTLESLSCLPKTYIKVANKDSTIFYPKWPAVSQLLIANKTLIMSATFTRSLAQYLLPDIPYEYIDVSSAFNPARHPFYYYPNIKMKSQMDDTLWKMAVGTFDQFIAPRLELHRNGIIHTTSYRIARKIARFSRFTDHIFLHNPTNLDHVLSKFKQSKGKILISPSVGEGYDFPNDQTRWQIIAKVPFVVPTPLMKARGSKFSNSMTALKLQQNVGRGMRHPKDWCETIIFDRHLTWAWKAWQNNNDICNWFKRKEVGRLPDVLEVS